eukprot:scaffold48110_cov18-Tisochrysis_lutea.AAC.3
MARATAAAAAAAVAAAAAHRVVEGAGHHLPLLLVNASPGAAAHRLGPPLPSVPCRSGTQEALFPAALPPLLHCAGAVAALVLAPSFPARPAAAAAVAARGQELAEAGVLAGQGVGGARQSRLHAPNPPA